jgi:RNA polymerase sigma-70 factor (ECF subfamily)
MTDPEARIIQDAKSGNNRAFGRLVKKHQERTLFLAYDLMGNYDDAKDLAQETFIRAFQKLSQYEKRAKFSTWLYRITVNLALDTHRKRRRNRMEFLDTGDDNVVPGYCQHTSGKPF